MLNRGLSNICFCCKQLINEDTLHGDRLDVEGTYFVDCFQYSPLLLGGQIIEHSGHLQGIDRFADRKGCGLDFQLTEALQGIITVVGRCGVVGIYRNDLGSVGASLLRISRE